MTKRKVNIVGDNKKDMKDPLPNFIPQWTKIVKESLANGEDNIPIYSSNVDGLDWYKYESCFVGEALGFDYEKVHSFKNHNKKNNSYLFYNGGVFATLKEFYDYKIKLKTSIDMFNK